MSIVFFTPATRDRRGAKLARQPLVLDRASKTACKSIVRNCYIDMIRQLVHDLNKACLAEFYKLDLLEQRDYKHCSAHSEPILYFFTCRNPSYDTRGLLLLAAARRSLQTKLVSLAELFDWTVYASRVGIANFVCLTDTIELENHLDWIDSMRLPFNEELTVEFQNSFHMQLCQMRSDAWRDSTKLARPMCSFAELFPLTPSDKLMQRVFSARTAKQLEHKPETAVRAPKRKRSDPAPAELEEAPLSKRVCRKPVRYDV